MESSDFMISDWVEGTRSYDCPESEQHDIEVTEKVRCSEILENYIISDLERYYDLKPIEITKEILELNGFSENGNDCILPEDGYDYIENEGYCFDLSMNYRIVVTIGPIKYVHQLQQGLRLSGQKERANNFLINVK